MLHTCEYLEKHGFEVTYLNVDENGVVDLEELKKAILRGSKVIRDVLVVATGGLSTVYANDGGIVAAY